MESLESGKISNPDEKRMVGHYWLRAPELAPNDAIRKGEKKKEEKKKEKRREG